MKLPPREMSSKRQHMNTVAKLLLVLAIGIGSQNSSYGSIHNNGVHTVASLAEICLEAEQDARDGAEEEAYCEQYLSGFAAALQLTRPGEYCFPEKEPLADRFRVAFTIWYFQNKKQHTKPAGEGLLVLVDQQFKC